jgi:aspartyl protease family protein
MKINLLISLLTSLVVSTSALAANRNYIVYDGAPYVGESVIRASVAPNTINLPVVSADGDYVVSRAADGQYHIPATINGFSVVFVVDTGAMSTSIPADLAANCGIRAGEAIEIITASGKSEAGKSSGNNLVIGSMKVNNVKVFVIQGLFAPLLGADVLNNFEISYYAGVMTIRKPKSKA